MKVQKLRRWKQADSGPLRDMDAVCFPTDTSFWNDERYHWWAVSTDSGQMVAYAGLRIDKEKVRTEKRGRDDDFEFVHVAHFTRAGVLPEYRGQGLQKLLIKARIAWCRRNSIVVIKTYTSSDNAASISSLKACGFTGRKSRDGRWVRFRKELT